MVDRIGTTQSFQRAEDLYIDDLNQAQIVDELEQTNITHVLTLLDQLFSELQNKLTDSQKKQLKDLKLKIHENTDHSKSYYNKKAILDLFSATLSSCIFVTTSSLFPRADKGMLDKIQKTLPILEGAIKNWLDGKNSKLNNNTELDKRTIDELQQGLQAISNAMNAINQAIQSGSDGERRALSR